MRIVLILLLCLSLEAKEYFVSKVYDGDTILARSEKKSYKIRLYGIDAPESKQNFGAYCTRKLSKKIIGKKVELKIKSVDKYKRKVAIVYLNGEDINRYMVDEGCAWAYTYYTNLYKKNELNSKREKRGLWIEPNPMNPYKFRKLHNHKRSEIEELKKLFKWMVA